MGGAGPSGDRPTSRGDGAARDGGSAAFPLLGGGERPGTPVVLAVEITDGGGYVSRDTVELRIGLPRTIFTDRYCAWGADYADEVFMVATQFNQFWDSTAHLALLGNLMINDIFLARGEGAEARLNEIARLYGAFTGHVGNPLTPVAQ